MTKNSENSQTEFFDYLEKFGLQKTLRLAKQKLQNGSIDDAEIIYSEIIRKFPRNQIAISKLKELSNKKLKNSNLKNEELQPILKLFNTGKFEETIIKLKELIQRFPSSPFLYNFLGINYGQLSQTSEALKNFKNALKLDPNYADGHCNLGSSLISVGNLSEAKEHLHKAIALNDKHVDAYNNLGNIYQKEKNYKLAIQYLSTALSINSNHQSANNNLGVVLNEQGEFDKAISYFDKAIKQNHKSHEAYNNRGIALSELGANELALSSYNQALDLRSDFIECIVNKALLYIKLHNFNSAIPLLERAIVFSPDALEANIQLGVALKEVGRIDDSIEAYRRVLELDNDNSRAWQYVYYPLSTYLTNDPQIVIEKVKKLTRNLNKEKIKAHLSLLHLQLQRGNETETELFSLAKKCFDNRNIQFAKNPQFQNIRPSDDEKLDEEIIALIHFGRSGTGLLHSLIDNHPEISTLPSIYFAHYFDPKSWNSLISHGWDVIIENFINTYPTFFDARSKGPIKSIGDEKIFNLGENEGMTTLGDSRNEVLGINKSAFQKILSEMMRKYSSLNAADFFKLVHQAYNNAQKIYRKKSKIFYHIHNPDIPALVNFCTLNKKIRWVLMVREPIQSCESWIRKDFSEHNYKQCTGKILKMLFEIDNIIYSRNPSAGVRLEDLKRRPRHVIPKLCEWLGISETASLYTMTAQGKKWWGDPSSPDYEKDGMNPFGNMSISRQIGEVFSDRDQYILNTLFYPFSLLYGYTAHNRNWHSSDLEKVKKMLDEFFDFERKIINNKSLDESEFKASGSYIHFRAALISRISILEKYQTYPRLIQPLYIIE